MSGRARQRGVALLTAMLAVAIVTVIAVEMTTRQHLDIRRTEHLLARDQAYRYAVAAEQWAIAMLVEDQRENERAVDHTDESWAQIRTPPRFEGAEIRLWMEDLQARFNLNNLVLVPGTDNEAAKARFEWLLRGLGIEPGIVQAAADWVDPSPQTRFPDGAGDDWYSRLDPPYRVANRPMASATELRLVRGVEEAEWRRIAPYVTALSAPTPINVNTAPAPVLRSLAPGLTATAAERLANDRPEGGWGSVREFLAHPAFAGQDVDATLLSVASSYFQFRSEVSIGRVTLRSEGIIHRSQGGGRVLLRRQGFFD